MLSDREMLPSNIHTRTQQNLIPLNPQSVLIIDYLRPLPPPCKETCCCCLEDT